MKQLAIFIMFCLICLLCSCAGDTGIEPDGDSPADGDVSTDGDESEGESSDGDADSDLEMEVELESEDQPDFETQWWEIGDVTGIQQLPEVSPFFADNRELIDEMSTWFDHVVHEEAGEESEDSSWRGYFGTGNGMAFAFNGTTFPFNTLHSMLGPEYQKSDFDGYFSDFSALLLKDNKLLEWKEQWVWKHRRALVNMTRMRHAKSKLELDSVSFAVAGADPGSGRKCIVHLLNVRNTGKNSVDDVNLQLQSFSKAYELGEDYIVQKRDKNRMRAMPLEDDWTVMEEAPSSTFYQYPAFVQEPFSLEAGAERQTIFVFEFAGGEDEIGAETDFVKQTGFRALLDQTIDWWKAWHDSGMSVETPDRKVNDLIEGLKASIKVQIAHNGAGVQVSHYTGSWHRDVFPPVRSFFTFGYTDEAWGMADYLYQAATVRGGIGNALSADMVIPDPLPEHDWMGDVPFTADRLKGEGPSFLPLMHLWGWRYTGEGERLVERWDYLMHALRGQTVTDEGYMYFSGDETFRPPMAVNIGYDAEYKFEFSTYSAYSAFLFVRACDMLADFIEDYGLDKADDLAWLRERASFVRERTEALYWMADKKMYSPFIYMDDLTPDPNPSEDVNTQPVWLGYASADEERSRQNMLSMMDMILQDNGILQNRFAGAGELLGYDISQGIMTGMAPAYFLVNLAEMNHQVAQQTFDAMGIYISPSGNYPEVAVFEPAGRVLCPLYDKSSVIGELWSRFRFWEGAISLEALMRYLVGFEADVIEGWVKLSPHLPHEAPFVAAERMMFKGHAISMRLAEKGSGFLLSVSSEDDPGAFGLNEYRLRLTLPLSVITALSKDGVELDAEDYKVSEPYSGASEIRLTLPATAEPLEIYVQ